MVELLWKLCVLFISQGYEEYYYCRELLGYGWGVREGELLF